MKYWHHFLMATTFAYRLNIYYGVHAWGDAQINSSASIIIQLLKTFTQFILGAC